MGNVHCNCGNPLFNPYCDVCDDCICSSCSNLDIIEDNYYCCPFSACLNCWHVLGGHSHPVTECPCWNKESLFCRL